VGRDVGIADKFVTLQINVSRSRPGDYVVCLRRLALRGCALSTRTATSPDKYTDKILSQIPNQSCGKKPIQVPPQSRKAAARGGFTCLPSFAYGEDLGSIFIKGLWLSMVPADPACVLFAAHGQLRRKCISSPVPPKLELMAMLTKVRSPKSLGMHNGGSPID